MSILYTQAQMEGVLKKLRIKAHDGRVQAREAARILSWRVQAEQDVTHEYTELSVRKHAKSMQVTHPLTKEGKVNTRTNLYPVEELFEITLVPQRSRKGVASEAAVLHIPENCLQLP